MRLFTATLVAGLLLVVPFQAASAVHFSLVRSTPTKDQKVEATAATMRLQLWFSQAPAAAVSHLALKRDTTEIALGKAVVVEAEKKLYADSVKPLEPGDYTLTWRAAGDDGHVLSGDVKFSIIPKGTP